MQALGGTAVFLVFFLSAACGGDDGETCSPPRTLQLVLEYGPGDCLDEGETEAVDLDVKADGSEYVATEEGEPAKETIWNAQECRLTVLTLFSYPETADSWPIEGSTVLQIDIIDGRPYGSGQLDATYYTDAGAVKCTQAINITD